MEKEFALALIERIAHFCANDLSDDCKNMAKNYLMKSNINQETFLSKRQFNEILLLCNEKRVTKNFFKYFTETNNDIEPHLPINKFQDKIKRFKIHSMLRYGNFRFAYNELSKSDNVVKELEDWLKDPIEIIDDYKNRPAAILNIDKIERDLVYLNGYLAEEVSEELLEKVRNRGKFNTNVYLTSDYMDVYVATSMRDIVEYQSVYDLCEEVFNDDRIKELNMRYFDPTQSFHENNRAKGLIEGLMLKRATCTIYAAQEKDSFGKDSELAATLAQGKPVIVFIPKVSIDDSKFMKHLESLPLRILIDRAESFRIGFDKKDWDFIDKLIKEISGGLEKNNSDETIKAQISNKIDKSINIISNAASKFYDYRANLIKYIHPLSFQVNLRTGVANGVLVVRTHKECSDILHDILTNRMEFDIVNPGEPYEGISDDKIDTLNYLLVEKKTKCAFRIVTKDELLTNSFWNFYLK